MKVNKAIEGVETVAKRTGAQARPKPISNLQDARKNARTPGSTGAGKESQEHLTA